MILVMGRIPLKPESRDKFLEHIRVLSGPSRAEPGCISYAVYFGATELDTALFVEEWESRQALDEHFETPHFRAFADALQSMTSDPPTGSVYYTERIESLD